MQKKDEIEDSIEFVKDIKKYYKSDSNSYTSSQSVNYNPQNNYYYKFRNSKNIAEKIDDVDLYGDIRDNYEYNSEFYKNSWDVTEENKDSFKFKEDISQDDNRSSAYDDLMETKVYSSRGKEIFMDFFKLILCVVLAYIFANLITTYVGQHTKVEGISMEDTLENDDYLYIDKLSYQFHEPERYDIIVFPYSKGIYYIKRIIGLPGETIQIIDGSVYVNGEALNESYGLEKMESAGIAEKPITLGEYEYFVLGDNRNSSEDSRFVEVGTIVRDKIVGKAIFRFWPLSEIGKIE